MYSLSTAFVKVALEGHFKERLFLCLTFSKTRDSGQVCRISAFRHTAGLSTQRDRFKTLTVTVPVRDKKKKKKITKTIITVILLFVVVNANLR